MGLPALKNDRHYTYADYKTWPEDERWELIRGEAWAMASPLLNHQVICANIFGHLWTWFRGKPCRVLTAPLDVFLFEPLEEELDADGVDQLDTVLQPDVLVFCTDRQAARRGVRGAPQLVVEILSPSTGWKDQKLKFELYEEAGVAEYWVVDPVVPCVRQFSRSGQKFGIGQEFRAPGRLESSAFEGLSLSLSDLFEGVREQFEDR